MTAKFRTRRTPTTAVAPSIGWILLLLPIVFGCEIVDPAESAPQDPDTPVDDGGDRGPGFVVTEGLDYSLPEWVEPEEFAGYVGHPDDASAQVGSVYRNWWTSWAELEPEQGQIDWELIDSRLDEAEADGYRLVLHVLNLVCSGGDPDRGVTIPNAVPAWVFEEFELTDTECVGLGGEWNIEVIPAWRPDIRDAFNDFILALGEHGITQRDALGAAYIHGISPSLGEEFWLEPWQTAILESRAGFSASVMQEWIQSRMDAYATAFGAQTRKLAWVGKLTIWEYSGDDYRDAAWNLVQYAWDIGAGNRSSIVEKYHISLDEPALGQWIDDDGYLHTDETIPPIAEGRYFGDENEEYGEGWVWRYGDTAGDLLRYRFAILRALQMQVRFLWTHAPAELLDPTLSTYARYSFGKTVASSPDAWSYLKQSAVSQSVTPARAVKNFERWLYQRDVPGGMTVPTERVDREFNAGSITDGAEGAFSDDTARRTDVASGERSIFFDLDDRFDVSGAVEIKVEIVDASQAAWYLEYVDRTGETVRTDAYTGQGDGVVRTVTFTLDSPRFAGDLVNDMDFRIRCEGPGDVTVRWVRLVRQDAP
jgi:hypothetical protein